MTYSFGTERLLYIFRVLRDKYVHDPGRQAVQSLFTIKKKMAMS